MKLLQFLLIGIMCLTLNACQRDEGVGAAPETDSVAEKNEPATASPADDPALGLGEHQVRGEVVRVNAAANTLVIKGEDGRQHTVKLRSDVKVLGRDDGNETGHANPLAEVKNLKPGAQVSVAFADEDNEKVATAIILVGPDSKNAPAADKR